MILNRIKARLKPRYIIEKNLDIISIVNGWGIYNRVYKNGKATKRMKRGKSNV